jgi:F0F1-type ATP synthase assembly protein I
VATEDPAAPSTPPPRKRPDSASASSQFATALELPVVLVSAIVVGGFFGYLLDRWLHTKPIAMLILGTLGFYVGVRDVLRRMARGE